MPFDDEQETFDKNKRELQVARTRIQLTFLTLICRTTKNLDGQSFQVIDVPEYDEESSDGKEEVER
jgi:hypothetical protein